MRISDWSSDVCSSDLVKIVRYRRESEMTANSGISDQALAIAAKVEAFVRKTVIPYEKDPRRDHHGAPTDELVMEMREHASAAESGRASCMGRVCTRASIRVGAHTREKQ